MSAGKSLPEWLTRRSQAFPETIAIEHDSQRLTYRELYRDATLLAGVLARAGVKPHDRVAVIAKDGLRYAVAVHALIQLNAILVPTNWRLTASEIAWQWQDAEIAAVLTDEVSLPLVEAASRLLPHVPPVWHVDALAAQMDGEPVASHHVELADVQAIIYTSGTTGRPKGALITYGMHWWSAIGSALQLGVQERDRWLSPMPLFHVGGLSVILRSAIYGTTAVLQDRFTPEAVNQAIDEENISLVSVVPVMLRQMLDARRDNPYPAALRCILLGGSGAPRSLLERCVDLGVPVAPTYGLTEANTQVATLSPGQVGRKLGSSGQPLMPTEIGIRVHSRWGDAFEEGEVVVRGPTVTPGYFRAPAETADAIRDGWLHTGDVGYLDDDGFLYVLDRRSDLIVSGGENVYPAEVESTLQGHPAVAEAAVVGKSDDKWGQVPVAFVVLTSTSVSAEQLTAYCREHLAGYKVPKEIVFVDSLPHNASGKLLRRNLRS